MNIKAGKYKGFYQFDNENHEKLRGFDLTYFTIEITDSNGQNFHGWVEDDFLSGGMPGRGSIHGIFKGNKISFVKSMPYLGMFIKDTTTEQYQLKIDKTRKHPLIYYIGRTTAFQNDVFIGKWYFKYDLKQRLLFWVKGIKTGGKWKMSKEPTNILS